jgi:hypothetical protein
VQPPPPGLPQQWPEPGSSGQPGPGSYGQPGPGGFDAPPLPGPGYPQPGYGPPWQAGQSLQPIAPTTQQTISLITFAAVGLLGLLGTILTLTLWINMASAVHRAGDICNRFTGEKLALCQQRIEHIPAIVVACLFVIMAAGLAATLGAVMLVLKRQMGQFLVLGGGIVMLLLSIGCEARYGATGRLTYDLVAGFVIAAVGGLMLIQVFRLVMGLPLKPGGGRLSGALHGGGPWPYGQPPQQNPSGSGGQPPPNW